MAYKIIVEVIVDKETPKEAYNRVVNALNAINDPKVSYEITDEWYDDNNEQLYEDEVIEAVRDSGTR